MSGFRWGVVSPSSGEVQKPADPTPARDPRLTPDSRCHMCGAQAVAWEGKPLCEDCRDRRSGRQQRATRATADGPWASYPDPWSI